MNATMNEYYRQLEVEKKLQEAPDFNFTLPGSIIGILTIVSLLFIIF